jgi:hypothetical protein
MPFHAAVFAGTEACVTVFLEAFLANTACNPLALRDSEVCVLSVTVK